MQKGFGKAPGQLEALLRGILYCCNEFKMPEIIEGLRVYVRNHSDIPAPNDILDIIDPQFKPDRAMYSHLLHRRKKNGLEDLSTSEQRYMQMYEKERLKELGL